MESHVRRVVWDLWDGEICEEGCIDRPKLSDVEGIILAMDARRRTIVTLYKGDDDILVVGGGDGRYVVYMADSEGRYWNLISGAFASGDLLATDRVLLNAGGQEGDFPIYQIVNRSQAIQAITAFYREGLRDESQRWECQK